jgi:hypothetical protein
MTEPESINARPTVRTFAPECWGEVEAIIALYSSTYEFDQREKRALGGVVRHFEKAGVFRDKAAKSVDALIAEQIEMNRRGYSAAAQGRETAQDIEAAITELYSCIDCTAKLVRAIYRKDSRGFRDSTSFLFTSAEKIKGGFPTYLKDLFIGAGWEKPLRHIREELVHYGTGHCDLTRNNNPTIRYLHLGIKFDGAPLEILDVIAWFDAQRDRVNTFLGAVFRFLRSTLKSGSVTTVCGMVDGRLLVRELDPSEHPITFHSGKCIAVQWIENPEFPTCPFIMTCGAYRRARPGIDPAAVLASKHNPEPWASAQESPMLS